MIDHVKNLIPEPLAAEMLRLARINRDWVRWEDTGVDEMGRATYQAKSCLATPLLGIIKNGSDIFSMHATSIWLVDGPKVFRATAAQCDAMEQVELSLPLRDYRQPFPAILVEFPRGRYAPFNSVLCYREDRMMVAVLNSDYHLDDITTTVRSDDKPIELSISRYDVDCSQHSELCGKMLRVAMNCCLALANYGHHLSYLIPEEVERDKRTGREDSERGRKARERVHMMSVRLDREVVLHRTKSRGEAGEATGRETSPHWRRGHWHTVACGKGRTERKLVLYPPVFVRADLAVGELSTTSTTYSS